MSLRDHVEAILPEWERWYPSLFDAAADLGVIRARVCPPSSLLLSRRHAVIYSEAVQAFRERWNALDEEDYRSACQPARVTRHSPSSRASRRSK
ncbi:MAG: hypothetical protein WBO00_06340 [Steroidobacteraceae bacterium]